MLALHKRAGSVGEPEPEPSSSESIRAAAAATGGPACPPARRARAWELAVRHGSHARTLYKRHLHHSASFRITAERALDVFNRPTTNIQSETFTLFALRCLTKSLTKTTPPSGRREFAPCPAPTSTGR